jgi:hypothetical protein
VLEDARHGDFTPVAALAVVGEQTGDGLHLGSDTGELGVERGFSRSDRLLEGGEFGVELGDLLLHRTLPTSEERLEFGHGIDVDCGTGR